MSKVFIEESTLSSIGNAIREKNGTTELITPLDMAGSIAAIESGGGGGYVPTDEELKVEHLSSNYEYSPYQRGFHYWILKEYGDRVKIYCYQLSKNIFSHFNREVFDVCVRMDRGCFNSMFYMSSNLKEITGRILPIRDGQRIPLYSTATMFYNCYNLRTINDDFIDTNITDMYNGTDNSTSHQQMFYNCYSLRELPAFYHNLKLIESDGPYHKAYSNSYIYNCEFCNCYGLNKIENYRVFICNARDDSEFKYNMFYNTFNNCSSLYKLTFQTNQDGSSIEAKWLNQTIDLTQSIGYSSNVLDMVNYNSGLLSEDMLSDANQQYYTSEGLTKYWTNNKELAKYGHTEAIETINSLPDTSAIGGGNTIKFWSIQGKYTDYLKGRTNDNTFDSSIGTLTEEEIAVATAKGWTVTLV